MTCCTVAGCDRPVFCRHRCQRHWTQWIRLAVPALLIGCGTPVAVGPSTEPATSATVAVAPPPVPTTTALVLSAPADVPVSAVVRVDPPTTVATTTTAPLAGEGREVAAEALLREGATASEVAFLVPICVRESRCTLDAHNYNPRTRDDSLGPWQLNFYGQQTARLAACCDIHRPTVNATWESAAASALRLVRTIGRCPWNPPSYCS